VGQKDVSSDELHRWAVKTRVLAKCIWRSICAWRFEIWLREVSIRSVRGWKTDVLCPKKGENFVTSQALPNCNIAATWCCVLWTTGTTVMAVRKQPVLTSQPTACREPSMKMSQLLRNARTKT